MNPTMNRLLVGLLAMAALVTLVGGAYLGYWWLRGDVRDRDVGIRNRNTGAQTAWRDEALDLINQADLLPEGAPQRGALEAQACDLIGRLTDTYRSDDRIVVFQESEC